MKFSVYFFAVSLLFVSTDANCQLTKRALFLGNSYTAVNSLPQLTASITASAGDSLITDNNTPGGYTLMGHSTNATSVSQIMQGNWDYVILQEQSQLPSFPDSQVLTEMFPYAKTLDSLINLYNQCAETMFYMTWGRKNGDASNCAVWPPVCTYQGMDTLLYQRYMMMADSNHAEVSPVGAVWKYIRQNYPLIDLYQSDESHPSEAGSYLAACCFYTSMFRKSPLSITYNYTLSAADALAIRQAVKTVVYDHLLTWHIGEYVPIANFNYIPNGNSVSFTNLSLNANSYLWDFGDGTNSTSFNPTHIYPANGFYNVKLTSSKCNISDNYFQTINIISTDSKEYENDNNFSVFPNPANNLLMIKANTGKIQKIILWDVNGRQFHPEFNRVNNLITLDLNDFVDGIYYLNITSDKNVYTKMIIKK